MRKNAVKYIVMLAGAALAAALPSCFPGMTDNSVKGPLELSVTDSIKVGKDPTKSYIGVTARDAGWTLTGDEDWCRASASSGEKGISQVTVTFTLNDTGGTRETAFVFVSGDMQKEIIVRQLNTEMVLPNQNPEYASNKAIHEEIINDWYLWNEETESTAADYNQQYDAFFNSYLTYLKKNELDGNTWAKNTDRYIYSYITRTPVGETSLAPLNYGMEFDITDYNVNRESRMVSRILYVMDKSPAANAGLKRGDWFYKVNNRQMYDYNYTRLIDTLVKPVYGFSPKLGMLTFQSYASNLVDNGRTVLVTPARYQGSPILNTYMPPISGTDKNGDPVRVGYLVYNRFDPAYESDLVKAFKDFKDNDITDLVLDLRYNNTGTVEMAAKMANLIVPADLDGEVFARYEFNAKHSAQNGTITIKADANSVGLKTVYILTSGHTAGAAELLINAFRGLEGEMTLIVIGDITEGMNVGMVKRPYTANGYQYDVYPAAFRCFNAKEEGDYRYGLSPNGGAIKEFYDSRDPESNPDNAKWAETWGWKGVPGMQEDRLLQQAMNYILKNTEMPAGPVLNAPSRQNLGYARVWSVQPSMTMEVP